MGEEHVRWHDTNTSMELSLHSVCRAVEGREGEEIFYVEERGARGMKNESLPN